MVGTLVGLHLKLFWRSLTASPQRMITLAVGLLYLGGLQYGVWAGALALRGAPVDRIGPALVTAFAVLAVVWLMSTFFGVGGGQTLDPGRFALLPVSGRQLLPGQVATSLVGLGGVWTVLACLAGVVAWWRSPLVGAAAVLAAVLCSLTCVLLTRVAALVFSGALASRKHRDTAALVLGVSGLGLGIGSQVLTRWAQGGDRLVERLQGTGRVVSWTPLGWAWALPWDVASGRWGLAVVRLVLALALVVGLLMVWKVFLDRALVSPLESSGGCEKVRDHSPVDRLVPSSPAGAIAARSLRYWRRDPRHLVQLVAATAMPLLMAAPVVLDGGDRDASLLAYPVLGSLLISSLVVQGEIGYDGSALWTQVVAGVPGRDDRWGRLIALAWIFVPVSLVVDTIFLVLSDSWRYADALVGCSLAALLVAAAVGTLVGAVFQTPQPAPGQNPFTRSSGGGITAVVWAFISMIASGALSLPFLVPALFVPGRWWLGVVLLVLAPVYGMVLVYISVRWGGRILDRSWPEVLDRLRQEGT